MILFLLSIFYEISSDLKTLKIDGNGEETTQAGVRSKGDYTQIINSIVGEGIISIGPSSFYQCYSLKTVALPSTLQKICNDAFRNSSIISIEIPEGVTEILSTAFYQCWNLQTIVIPSTVTEIKTLYLVCECQNLEKFIVSENNPKYSSLWMNRILVENAVTAVCCAGAFDTIEIPSSIRTIGPSFAERLYNIANVTFKSDSALELIQSAAFVYTSIREIRLPSKLKTVEDQIFRFVPTLTKIFIPKSLTTASSRFLEGTKITDIEIEDGCPALKLIDGVIYNVDLTTIIYIPVDFHSVTIRSNVTLLTEEVLQRCSMLEEVNLESNNKVYMEFLNVIYMNDYAQLFACPGGIKNVTVHENCTSFAIRAFRDTLVEEVHFAGNKFQTMGVGIFARCYHLKIFDVPSSLVTIGSHSFSYANLQGFRMKFGKNLKRIDMNVWDYSNISYLDFSDSTEVTSIPQNCFSECAYLTELILPPNVETINSKALFNSQSLTSISIPSTTQNIYDSVFQGCSSLTKVIFEDVPSLQSLRTLVFSDCDIREIDIPDSVTKIYPSALSGNRNMARISFSSSSKLQSIGTGAFTNCSLVTSINIENEVNDISVGAFSNMFGLLEIIVVKSNENYISVNKSLFSKDEKSLWCCPSGLTEANIGGKLERIESAAFMGCIKLERLIFDGEIKLKTIAAESFYGCIALEAIRIPKSVQEILENAFKGCSGLKEVSFEDGSLLGSIESGSFGGCSELASVTFEGNSELTSIEEAAFQNCAKLQTFVFPNSLQRIGDSSFFGCAALRNVTLNEGLKTISGSAFSGCLSITSIALPSSLTSLGAGAFSGCKKLSYVSYCGRSNLSANISFNDCSDYLYAEASIRYDYMTIGGLIPRRAFDDNCHRPTVFFSEARKSQIGLYLFAEILESESLQ